MQELKFIKMEGIGNDYVFIDQRQAHSDFDPQAGLIQQIADRHTGVGGDGLVLIQKSAQAAARMVMFNADGSRSEMCGNALRCIGLHVFQSTGERSFQLQSDVGLHAVRVLSGEVGNTTAILEVNQGPPVFERSRIPFARSGPVPALNEIIEANSLSGNLYSFAASIISMGNPHCVVFVDDADAIMLDEVGPLFENHQLFPQKTNVEFISLEESPAGDKRIYQRTWERGSGETLACGSGACAVAVAAVLTGHFEKLVPIRLRGGELELEWDGRNNPNADVLLRGPARIAFRGTYPIV